MLSPCSQNSPTVPSGNAPADAGSTTTAHRLRAGWPHDTTVTASGAVRGVPGPPAPHAPRPATRGQVGRRWVRRPGRWWRPAGSPPRSRRTAGNAVGARPHGAERRGERRHRVDDSAHSDPTIITTLAQADASPGAGRAARSHARRQKFGAAVIEPADLWNRPTAPGSSAAAHDAPKRRRRQQGGIARRRRREARSSTTPRRDTTAASQTPWALRVQQVRSTGSSGRRVGADRAVGDLAPADGARPSLRCTCRCETSSTSDTG